MLAIVLCLLAGAAAVPLPNEKLVAEPVPLMVVPAPLRTNVILAPPGKVLIMKTDDEPKVVIAPAEDSENAEAEPEEPAEPVKTPEEEEHEEIEENGHMILVQNPGGPPILIRLEDDSSSPASASGIFSWIPIQLPSMPSLPTIPSLPTVPIPSLPTFPTFPFPTIPSIPGVPSLPSLPFWPSWLPRPGGSAKLLEALKHRVIVAV